MLRDLVDAEVRHPEDEGAGHELRLRRRRAEGGAGGGGGVYLPWREWTKQERKEKIREGRKRKQMQMGSSTSVHHRTQVCAKTTHTHSGTWF